MHVSALAGLDGQLVTLQGAAFGAGLEHEIPIMEMMAMMGRNK